MISLLIVFWVLCGIAAAWVANRTLKRDFLRHNLGWPMTGGFLVIWLIALAGIAMFGPLGLLSTWITDLTYER